ncbi:MAG: hypothetical protein EZS28_000680 [Streblomastix strix]|uniref:Uncharacterized protein n=1 Tax=Streblomastix strix TaxID=222440 RepID=A0A5J4X9B6_9EUKA|nr:MAG: hypothetical protein EZS28_000680 [Streblomastix strix]
MTKFTDMFNLVVNIYTYHEELEGKTDTNKRANEYFNTHVEKCKSSTDEPSILLLDVPMPICPAILNHPTIEYLMAYDLMDQFKAQRGFITYDFETVSDQVMKNITDQTTLLSQLSKLSIASTEVYPTSNKSYELIKRCYTLFDELSENYQEQLENYELPSNSSFVHLWLSQTFESAEQIYQCMKYDNENIPFDKCIKVLGWNSSRFDISLLWDALDCELWTMDVRIGYLNNTKSITVTHKKSHMKLQFIDAQNLFGQMTLKAYVKDYGDKSEHKDVFPYEIINSKNQKDVLVKTEPFQYEDFKSQLKGSYSITKDEYDQYLIDFKRFTNRLEYLKYYNINDNEIMVKPLMNLIDTFEQFYIDVLHYISIASCAYATKHYSTYFPSQFNLESENHIQDLSQQAKACYYEDFDINADYTNPNPQAKPFVLTAGYWKNKCYHYKQQDYKAGRETEKNVTADDYAYYKKLFETSVCSICSAKFIYDNPPSLDKQDNELPHTKDNCLPACISCNIAHVNRNPNIASLHIRMRYYDTLNTEKFGKIKMLDKADTFIAQHHPNHIDRKRFHFVLADTDSIYIAIAGDPVKDCHQKFEANITDKQFYDQHVYQYLLDPNKNIYDYKKILGFGIENEGYELTSLRPKCYSMIKHKWSKERQQYEFKPKITSKRISIEALESLHIDWHAIWKAIYEAGIKFACESKLCK